MSLKQKQLITLSILCTLPLLVRATSKGLDQRVNEAFMPFAIWWENLVFTELNLFGFGIPLVLILLLSGATFFTFYFGFINIRHFPTAIKVVRGKYDEFEQMISNSTITTVNLTQEVQKSDDHHGEVNHFQALATAVSGTVGLGNIAMVAVAISVGGPGATFWMVIAGLLGMSSKFVECTLGVKYRDIDKQGNVYGGPMYYLSRGLKEKGFKNLGRFWELYLQ